jgi:para-aminobenzoate synthetase/4-amino-4-deoxychorismate lyase
LATRVIAAPGPFVLLDDARAGGGARFFQKPVEIITARSMADVRPALRRLRETKARGLHAAGFISYEAGLALEPKLHGLLRSPAGDDPPLLWFGLFEACEDMKDVQALLPDPRSAWLTQPRPLVESSDYEEAVGRAKQHIRAGDVYQANLTFAAEVLTGGSPLAIYASLRQRARAGHSALLFTGEHWLLSCSPELFFTLEEGRVTTRPMKGTAERGATPAEDAAAIEALASDPKQRAENLIIVDLLRNDLSRVSRPGSVKVPALFAVETYPTVHQMTSTVTSLLEEGRDVVDVLEALFPCGSITGAPKIRAMEIIAGLEEHDRRVYTGSIGSIAPDGDASFNVAIRTLTMKAGEKRALMGLGSGIVADSEAAAEWRECLAKGAFVYDPARSFDLIETMRFDPHDGISDIERHLGRMKASAEALGFAFDRHDARNELQAATFRLRDQKKLRLLLSPSGALAIEVRPLPERPKIAGVAIAPLPVPQDDFRLSHKTTDRAFYDEAREQAGAFEVVFEDQAGFLTEGSFTNIFAERDGKLVTPPLSRGLLPGVLRERLLHSGEAVEGDLVAADLVSGFYLGNAVRGLIPAILRQPATSSSAA